MSRHFSDWLTAYVEYASFSEAPKRMHFWSGVAAVAGALQRKVWIDMGYFKWHCNMYIILVAPPGIVAKSTTADIAISLLKKVPGIKFGPNVVTWQALVTSFSNSMEMVEIPLNSGEWFPQCALTLESSEFGNLVNPSDREMVDMLVNLWDGKTGLFEKLTKKDGKEAVENPWINLIACTTPAWIAGNFPEYVIGGGFTSRCLFVYADEKDKYVAYPIRNMPKDFYRVQTALTADLEHINQCVRGQYQLTDETIKVGTEWYEYHWQHKPDELDDDRFSGYLSRKQTHVHKTAMVLAASRHDDMVIEADDFKLAAVMVSDLERDMQKVFARIGRTQQSVHAERFIRFVHKQGIVTFSQGYQYIHSAFPDVRNFEGIVIGACKAGFMELVDKDGQKYLRAKKPV